MCIVLKKFSKEVVEIKNFTKTLFACICFTYLEKNKRFFLFVIELNIMVSHYPN